MSAGSSGVSVKRRRRPNYSLAASLGVSLCCTGAVAATQAPSSTQGPPPKVVEEVIVTAQRRAERLQDVPISISVMNGRELDSFSGEGVSEALTRVPGVTINQSVQAGGTQVSMRGVSASDALFNGSSPIAYYLDSVPFGLVKSALVPDSSAYDLERIEALRGPQGTLYGANAINGVVRVLTRDADLDNFELKARTSLSTTEDGSESYRGDVAVNLPIVRDRLAARAVVGYAKLGGWIDRPGEEDANDAELRNFRLKVNAQPTDQLSLGLSAWLSRSDYGMPPVSDDEQQFPTSDSYESAIDYDVFGLSVGYDFGAFTLSSKTSYIDYTNDSEWDLSLLGLGVLATEPDSKVRAEELTLSSTGEGPWRWTAGGFYRDAEDRLFQSWPGVLPANNDFSDTSESFAIFGELTRVLLDGKLDVTAGLRYFEDKVEQIENAPFDGDTSRPLTRSSTTFTHVSPRFVLTLHPSERSTYYASYSEGFRSGFNQNANVTLFFPEFPPVHEDKLKNYELGTKGSSAGGRFRYEAAAYYIDWQDVQQTLFVEYPPGTGAGISAVVNGSSASGVGVDFGMTTMPVDGLEVGVSVNWNDLALDEPVVAAGGVVLFDKGDRLNYSSEYTAGATIEYTFRLGGLDLDGTIGASANYNSRLKPDSDDILIGRTSFSIEAAERWTAALFVDNVANEQGTPVKFPIEAYNLRVRPRTVGLQFEYRY